MDAAPQGYDQNGLAVRPFSAVGRPNNPSDVGLTSFGPEKDMCTEEASANGMKEPKYKGPDGGIRAWLVVLGAWCCLFCSFGWIYSIGVFQEYYQHFLLRHLSSSTIAWIPSLQLFFMMAMGPVVGLLFDKDGPKKLILFGSFLHVFGLMMASLGTKYYQILLAQGVCSAIGASAIFQAGMNSVHSWFDKKRGAAFGVLSTGASVGGVIFPIMLTQLVQDIGYAWAMRAAAFLILGLMVIANLTVRCYKDQEPQKLTREMLRRSLMDVDYLILVAGFFCLTYGIFLPFNYLPVHALKIGMGRDLVQYLIPILNAASLFGRLFAGFFSDKIGCFNIFILVCYASAICILGVWLVDPSESAIIVFAALYGFFSGGFLSLVPPVVKQVTPSVAEIGLRTGIGFLVSSVAGLTTNPISGAILDGPNGWTGVRLYSGIFCTVGTTFALVVRMRRTAFKLKVKY